MGKPTICIGENKGADQLCGNRVQLISDLVFATRIVQFLLYLTLKLKLLACFYSYTGRLVSDLLGHHIGFLHEAAHYYLNAHTARLPPVQIIVADSSTDVKQADNSIHREANLSLTPV